MEIFISAIIDLIDKYYHQKNINRILLKLNLRTVFDVGAHKGEFSSSLIPSLKSHPCTKVIETGCNIAIPPPSEAAATNSGLEQGYIAPQIIGYSTFACLVKVVSNRDE